MFDMLSMACRDNADDSDREYRFVTIEYGLCPNSTQAGKLAEALSACGSAYNHLLAECKADAIMGIRQRGYRELTSLLPGMKASDPRYRVPHSQCLQDVCRRVVRAMSGCGWNEDGDPEHLPRFKSRHRYHSFTYLCDQGFGFVGDRLHLGNIGDVRFLHKHFPKGGEARTCTIRRNARGKWKAFVTFRVPLIVRNEECIERPRVPRPTTSGSGTSSQTRTASSSAILTCTPRGGTRSRSSRDRCSPARRALPDGRGPGAAWPPSTRTYTTGAKAG